MLEHGGFHYLTGGDTIGRTYGSESLIHPLRMVVNGSYGILQLDNRSNSLIVQAAPRDMAEVSLLISKIDVKDSGGSTELRVFRLQHALATDQHAAMTAELEELASGDPQKFSPDQIWVLVRAIKVQSQILQLYVGGEVMDV